MNFTEITITGGEPLVYFEGFEVILSNCNKWFHPPEIKICTNGLLLDKAKLQIIKKYRGKIELNISLHTINDNTFRKMTGVNIELNKYSEIFRLLNDSGIDYRLNSVILKCINDSNKSLLEYFNYAFDNDVKSVHLLELLVTREQKELIKYYTNILEIENNINTLSKYYSIDLVQKTNKKITFMLYSGNKHIKVVLYRLSCRCGCESCLNENDIKIGADMHLYPCYLEQEADCGNAVLNLKNVVECRDKFISSNNSDYSAELLYWGE